MKKLFMRTFIIMFIMVSTALFGATVTVTNTNDSGAGSLRQAIADASAGDTINFSVTGTITLTSGELSIGKNLTITGPGSGSLSINGNANSRIFNISSGTVSISGLTITNGNVNNYGGGIENAGDLTLESCVISNCQVTGGSGLGGGIDNYSGAVAINNCVISGCTSANEGGGVYSGGGSGAFSITNSTIKDNTSTNTGGGFCYRSTGTVTVSGSTFSGNQLTGGTSSGGGVSFISGTLNMDNTTISGNSANTGAGISDGGGATLNINNSTITDNTAANAGGGTSFKSAVNIKNSILAANTAPTDANFQADGGSIVTGGYNLCDGTLAAFSGTGDIQNGTLNIGALADNGGSTQTHKLLSGSDAIDKIPSGGNGHAGTDQIGTSRPQGTHADIGAYELAANLTVSTQAVNSIASTTATGNGNIESLGSSNPTAHGVCWNTTGTPTTSDSLTNEGGASATGAFTSNITGLSPNTTYYVRAYATNTDGTVYGSQVSFTTNGVVPTVTTQAVTSITATSATGNGNLTALGVPNPISHGFCWNTTGTPTTGDTIANRGGASSTGAFTANISSLNPNTTYYVRAYATNSAGTSYGSQVSFTTDPLAPTVTTQAVTSITTTTATGNGNITSLGAPNPTAHGICWNTTGTPTTADNTTNGGAASSTGAFTGNITGLSTYTTYYVRAYATNTAGTSYGNEVYFTTNGVVPTVTTQAVSSITASTATGNGNITALGIPNPTSHGFCWNTTGTPTTGDSTTNAGAASSTGAFTGNITGLSGSTTYYVRAYATNVAGTSYGTQVSFTTATSPPTVTTQAVSSITTTAATGNGNITSLGSANPTAYGVCWNTSGTPTTADSSTNEGGASSTGAFTSNITGLNAYTTYYVRAYATNGGGTSYGTQVSFTTNGVTPTLTTQAVSSIAARTATGNGNITDLGTPNPTAHGVCWNTTGTPTTADSKTDEGAASSTGAFTSNITGLNGNTTYYVRAYATNAQGTAYGNQVTFTTAVAPPVVTTQSVSSITTTTAAGNGNITDLGTTNPTAFGVCWNTTGTPTTADSKTNEGGTSSTGAFTSTISGLSSYTTYYVRAYATNSGGTSYGTQVTFTTEAEPPVVTTNAATDITNSTATGNGNITGAGVPNATAHGFCWNTTGTPTVSDSKTNEGAVSSTGAFTSNITGLNGNTTYYVRAYATNPAGTVYGASMTFTTSVSPPVVTTSAVTDIDVNSATGNGNITDLGSVNPTDHGVCWNTTGAPTTANDKTSGGATSATGSFTAAMTGLSPDTTYYVRAYATNTGGTSYGSEVTFTTVVGLPVVTTSAATSITPDAAVLNGSLENTGSDNPSAHGFCWNNSGTPTVDDQKRDLGTASGIGVFSTKLTGLAPNTTYYVRAFATNSGGTGYGSEISFTTTADMPVVTTVSVVANDSTSLTATGSATGTDIIEKGICWSETAAPDINSPHTAAGAGAGTYKLNIKNLKASTNYYVRAYARNSYGTTYGSQVQITTADAAFTDLDPEDGIGGKVEFKVTVNSPHPVEKVTFYIDNERIGVGTLVNSRDGFTLNSGDYYFRNSSKELKRIESDGNVSEAVNKKTGCNSIEWDGENYYYLSLNSPVKLKNGKSYYFLRISDSGLCQGLSESRMFMMDSVRFDGKRKAHCFVTDSNGHMAMKRIEVNGEIRTLFTVNSEVRCWAVRSTGDFVVVTAGSNKSVVVNRYNSSGSRVGSYNISDRVESATADSDGTIWLAGTTDHLKLYRDSGDENRQIDIETSVFDSINDIAVSEVGIYVSGSVNGSSELLLYNRDTSSATLIETMGIEVQKFWKGEEGLQFLGRSGNSSRIGYLLNNRVTVDRELFEDIASVTRGSSSESTNNKYVYVIEWDSSTVTPGGYTLSAVVEFENGSESKIEEEIKVAGMKISIESERLKEKAWLVTKEYAEMKVEVTDIVEEGALIFKVQVKGDGGDYSVVKEFNRNELNNGIYKWTHKYLPSGEKCKCRIDVYNISGEKIETSREVEI